MRRFVTSPHMRNAAETVETRPMLDEASLFAVQTCPFIAAPKYARSVSDKMAQSLGAQDMTVIKLHDEAVTARPTIFVRVMTIGHRLVSSSEGDVLFVTKKPYRKVEFWRRGGMVNFEEGVAISVESSDGELTERQVLEACGKR
jgi:hypothetical protein